LAITLLLQGGGGAATLLAALWIGRALGPAQQGQFNQLKSLVDLGAALAALGMPQALYVAAQSGRLELGAARRLSLKVALLGWPVGLALAWWHGLAGPGAASVAARNAAPGWMLAAALAAAVALATLQAQWRALTLLGQATWRFNLVTVAPQGLLLAVAAWVVAQGGVEATALASVLAALWLLASWYAGQALMRLQSGAEVRLAPPAGSPAPGPAAWGELARHGLATWAAASLATLAIVLLQRLAQQQGGAAALGMLSLALLLVQVPLTPLNYALPLLLRHRLGGGVRTRRMVRFAPLVAAPFGLLALAVLALGSWRSDLGLGAGYTGLHQVLAWLMLAGAAEAVLRVVTVDTQAEGQPWRSAAAEAARVLVLLAGAASGWPAVGSAPFAQAADALALWWALASAAAVAVLWALGQGAHRAAEAA
jgi:hypothetical protein